MAMPKYCTKCSRKDHMSLGGRQERRWGKQGGSEGQKGRSILRVFVHCLRPSVSPSAFIETSFCTSYVEIHLYFNDLFWKLSQEPAVTFATLISKETLYSFKPFWYCSYLSVQTWALYSHSCYKYKN